MLRLMQPQQLLCFVFCGLGGLLGLDFVGGGFHPARFTLPSDNVIGTNGFISLLSSENGPNRTPLVQLWPY